MLTQRDLGWIAGFIEGEGHFRFQRNSRRGGGALLVTADQVQRHPLDRLVVLVGGKIYDRPTKGAGIRVWVLYGSKAAGLMMTLYPMMSPRRRVQIADALAAWKKIRPWKHLTHCKRGHEFTIPNTMIWGDGFKRCRACDQQLRGARRRLRLVKPA